MLGASLVVGYFVSLLKNPTNQPKKKALFEFWTSITVATCMFCFWRTRALIIWNLEAKNYYPWIFVTKNTPPAFKVTNSQRWKVSLAKHILCLNWKLKQNGSTVAKSCHWTLVSYSVNLVHPSHSFSALVSQWNLNKKYYFVIATDILTSC